MLRDSQQWLQCVIDLSSDCYWEQDENHRFTLLLHQDSTRPENDPAQFLGKAPWELGEKPVHGTWDDHRAVRDATQAFTDLLVLRRDPGLGDRYYSVSGQPIIDAEGRFRGYRGITRDISKEHRDQRLLRLEMEITRILDGEDAEAALVSAIRAVCESERWDAGQYWHIDDAREVAQIHAGWSVDVERIREVVRQARALACGPGIGLAGTVWQSGEKVCHYGLRWKE
jgi:hypothetical protein